jgi:hypothetical protein
LHPYTLRSAIKLCDEKGLSPLYRKYENLMGENGLPIDVMLSEAESFAKMINGAEMEWVADLLRHWFNLGGI